MDHLVVDQEEDVFIIAYMVRMMEQKHLLQLLEPHVGLSH